MNTDIDFMSLSENDKAFVNEFENFVNGRMSNAEKTGMAITTMHRYLQQQAFKVCLGYIKGLAHNYRKGRYDQRNEWASQLAEVAYKSLIEADLIYDHDFSTTEIVNTYG